MEEKQKGSQQFKGTSSFTIHMEEKKKKNRMKAVGLFSQFCLRCIEAY